MDRDHLQEQLQFHSTYAARRAADELLIRAIFGVSYQDEAPFEPSLPSELNASLDLQVNLAYALAAI